MRRLTIRALLVKLVFWYSPEIDADEVRHRVVLTEEPDLPGDAPADRHDEQHQRRYQEHQSTRLRQTGVLQVVEVAATAA